MLVVAAAIIMIRRICSGTTSSIKRSRGIVMVVGAVRTVVAVVIELDPE